MIHITKQKGVFCTMDTASSQKLEAKGFGERTSDHLLVLSLYEVLFLLEKKKVVVVKGKKELSFDDIAKNKVDVTAYVVYKDLKKKGYEVKSALKYGLSFRVYAKGVKATDDHALWLVEPIHESERFKMREIAGKNRVAHSTKKKLLFGVVDDSLSVTYLEMGWKRL